MSALGENRPKGNVIIAEPSDSKTLAEWFTKRDRPDALVCESDYIAAQLRNRLSDAPGSHA